MQKAKEGYTDEQKVQNSDTFKKIQFEIASFLLVYFSTLSITFKNTYVKALVCLLAPSGSLQSNKYFPHHPGREKLIRDTNPPGPHLGERVLSS